MRSSLPHQDYQKKRIEQLYVITIFESFPVFETPFVSRLMSREIVMQESLSFWSAKISHQLIIKSMCGLAYWGVLHYSFFIEEGVINEEDIHMQDVFLYCLKMSLLSAEPRYGSSMTGFLPMVHES